MPLLALLFGMEFPILLRSPNITCRASLFGDKSGEKRLQETTCAFHRALSLGLAFGLDKQKYGGSEQVWLSFVLIT